MSTLILWARPDFANKGRIWIFYDIRGPNAVCLKSFSYPSNTTHDLQKWPILREVLVSPFLKFLWSLFLCKREKTQNKNPKNLL